MKPLPYSVPDLVKELDELIPPRCITPASDEREALFYGGKRALVEELKLRLESTHKKGMKEALTKE